MTIATADYSEFLANKRRSAAVCGFDVDPNALHSSLFPFQRDIVIWACKRGRAAIFADTGLGKTRMQVIWAHEVHCYTGGDVLILAPLAVAHQTVREAERIGITVRYCRDQSQVRQGITIANYEMLSHFDVSHFVGGVLDESSILKSYTGKTCQTIIDRFAATPYLLANTATPAPNDYMEFGTHAEFLGVMSRTEMLSMYFVHDGGNTSVWRLKGHAETDFFAWLATWSVTLTTPSDMGYDDTGYILPPLTMHRHALDVETDAPPTALFTAESQTLIEQRQSKRNSLSMRVRKCAELVAAEPGEQWLIWCELNAEGDALEKAIPGAVQVAGSDTSEFKERALLDFADGKIRVLVSKSSICGFGMNWQNCARIVFVGVSHSFEQTYQAIRRCWRFGQIRPVECHLLYAVTEAAIIRNLERKEAAAHRMKQEMVKQMQCVHVKKELPVILPMGVKSICGRFFTLLHGDCVDTVREMASDSIGYSLFSPPFASLYTYSNSERDMGNSKDYEEFRQHFHFLLKELYRVLMPGRLLSFHCMNLPTSKERHGYIGVQDFRGDLIRWFQEVGFIFHSEVVIWKDPVQAMQRTKAIGLLYKQLRKDSALSRQGIPDYLVTMRKPGENAEPVTKTPEDFPVDLWQNYASPVWMDINPSNTLQRESAREERDERHICPLQLEVIERALQLWTNPDDLVLSPFAGIGSEGYIAVKMGRRFIGVELKPSYFEQAALNLRNAEIERSQQTLFEVD